METSQITKAMVSLTKTVEKYIARDDVWETMTKKELADLLHKEYPEDGSLFKKLEADGGSSVLFEEFVAIATDPKLMSNPKSDITAAMQDFKTVFNSYAQKDSSKKTMTKSELCALLNKEFTKPPSEADVSRLLPQLDGNGVISFNEFVTAVVLNFDV